MHGLARQCWDVEHVRGAQINSPAACIVTEHAHPVEPLIGVYPAFQTTREIQCLADGNTANARAFLLVRRTSTRADACPTCRPCGSVPGTGLAGSVATQQVCGREERAPGRRGPWRSWRRPGRPWTARCARGWRCPSRCPPPTPPRSRPARARMHRTRQPLAVASSLLVTALASSWAS